MFSSLRWRLWLSYALVIFGNLLIIAFVLIIYLIRNPLIQRQTIQHLNEVETKLLAIGTNFSTDSRETIQARLIEFAKENDVRILIFSDQREILVDTGAGWQADFPVKSLRMIRINPVIKDTEGQTWITTVKRISPHRWLEIAVMRPKVELLSILRDEIVPPFATAGFTALFLSLVLAFLLSRWIAKPLQRIVEAANDFPTRGEIISTLDGPREVQELTNAFNQMVERIRSSQKSQRDFIASVSHELKTPLTSIQGFAQALKDGTADTPSSKDQATNVILNESERMHRMVIDLLDLAKLDGGTADLKKNPVNLDKIISDLITKFAPLVKKSGVDLLYTPTSLPIIQGDPDRLNQVFSNLIDNAIKFTPKSGSISIESKQEAEEIVIIIKDTGIGIAENDLPHIFDRFYQGDPSRKGGIDHGTGLGLAIISEIINAHNGKIDVSSIQGEGSIFTVKLPL